MNKNRKVTILLCDDDPNKDSGNARRKIVLEECFTNHNPTVGLEIIECTEPGEIDARLAQLPPGRVVDLALLDVFYEKWEPVPGETGRFRNVQTPELLSKEVTYRVARDPKVKKVVILTGLDHGESEISLIESGAYDYWHKGELLNEQLFQKRLEETLDLPSRYSVKEFQQDFADDDYVKENFNFDDAVREIDKNLIGKNPEIDRVKRLIFEASQFDESVPVLITGETGTGKEVVATLIHRLSKRGRVMRRDNPVTINCGVYSDDNLLRAELFGTHRGAFTGAMEREGVLEANKGTTLFLDEVGNSLPRFQEILLRAIENREGARLGSSKSNEYKIDLRFIAATDRNIIDDKQFSQPFLNRIRGLHIHLPSLRERGADVITLAEYFLKKAVKTEVPELTVAAKKALMEFDWPGNVRQLRHLMDILGKRVVRRRSSTTATSIGDMKRIYRDEIEMLLPNGPTSVEASGELDTAAMIVGRPNYAEARDRFSAAYVRLRHGEINGAERSNAAYDRTAAALDVSRSTVKKWLQPPGDENEQG